MAISDEGHEIDELDVVGGRTRLGALEHDRTERAGRYDRASTGLLQLLEPDIADPAAGFFFLVGKEQPAAGAAAERIVTIANRLLELDVLAAELREQLARLVHRTRIASEVAGIVEGDRRTRARFGGSWPHIPHELGDKHGRMDDLHLVAEPPVVFADRLHAVRTRREDLFRAGRPQLVDVRGRQFLEHVLVAGALGGISVALLFRQHAEADIPRPENVEERAKRFLEVCLEGTGASEPDEDVVLRRIEDLEGGRRDELLPLVVAEAPDVPAALEMVVHRAQILRRLTVRHQPAPRADDDRRVLDADRALVLAGAARRALPQDLLAVEVAELAVTLAGKHRLLRLKDKGLGIQLLPRPKRRAVHLAAAAFDTRERVEHGFLAEILHGLEADLFLLEIQIRNAAKLRRLQKNGDRRKYEVQVLRGGDQRKEREDHQHVYPPVDAAAERGLFEVEPEQKRGHQRRDEQRDDDRFNRDCRTQRGRPEDGPPHHQEQDAGEYGRRERDEHDAIREEPARVRQVDDAKASEELDARVAGERDEAPEHERVREPDNGSFPDGAHLKNDIDEEPLRASAHVVECERSGGGSNEADA